MFLMKLENTERQEPRCITLEPQVLEMCLYDPCEISILSGICEALQDWGALRFVVSGFGESEWPSDVKTELCIAMEQLPEIAHWLSSADRESICALDFYEQGVERYLTISYVNQQALEIKCESRTLWKPNPESEFVSVEEFRLMLASLVQDLIRCGRAVAPGVLTEHPMFFEWIDNVSSLN